MIGSGAENERERPEKSWAAHLRAAEQALARRSLRASVRAWDAAHLAATGSPHWERVIEVGDAYLRTRRESGPADGMQATARRHHFAALCRAAQKAPMDGIH